MLKRNPSQGILTRASGAIWGITHNNHSSSKVTRLQQHRKSRRHKQTSYQVNKGMEEKSLLSQNKGLLRRASLITKLWLAKFFGWGTCLPPPRGRNGRGEGGVASFLAKASSLWNFLTRKRWGKFASGGMPKFAPYSILQPRGVAPPPLTDEVKENRLCMRDKQRRT